MNQRHTLPAIVNINCAGRSLLAGLLGGSLLLTIATTAHALDPAYLAEWPTVERMLADHQGEDHYDTLARQMAALNQLDQAMEDLADERRWSKLTSDEIRLRNNLRQAASRLREEANANLSNELGPGFHWPFEEAPRQAWHSRQWQYESDPDIRSTTLSRYLSPPLLAELDVRKTASDERGRASGRALLRQLGYRETRWQLMQPAQRDFAIGFGLAMALLFLFLLVRESRRFGARPDDPTTLRRGFRRDPVTFVSGVVEDYQSNSGGYHEGFKLFDGSGWYTVGVSGAWVEIPDGHRATAASVSRPSATQHNYILFFDHDTQAIRPVLPVLQRLFAPSAWLLVPTLGFAFLFGATTSIVPGTSMYTGGLVATTAIWLVTESVLSRISERRTRRFVERDAPHIREAAAKAFR